MKRTFFLLSIGLCLGTFMAIFAQDESAGITRPAVKITDHIYKITGDDQFEVNITISVGPDGILLVDAGTAAIGEKLVNVLDSLFDGPVRYIINTHAHNDHTGGNKYFKDEATIVAHSNVRERMSGKYFALPPLPQEGMPDTTFDNDFILNFNGEEVQVKHFPPGHTDNDAVVYFTKSKVACLGDLLFSDNFPYVDVPGGGDVDGYRNSIGQIIEWLPKDVILISGHRREYNLDELRKYHDMLGTTIDIVRKQMAEGKSLDEIMQAKVLSEWDAWGTWYIINADSWIRWIYASLSQTSASAIVSICRPLSETIMQKGVEEAARQYRDLKANHAAEYSFDENELNILGYQLMARNMIDAAIGIFKLNIEAYPESGNAYDSMGEAYMNKGDKELAIKNYEKSLELNPENDNAKWALEKLRGE